MSSRHEAKSALFEALASVAKALGSGRRAEMVELLAQGEHSVEEVATITEQSVANASHHLRTLARAGLVATRRDGPRVYYRLARRSVAALWVAIRDVASEQLAEVERLADAYLGETDGLEPIGRDELWGRLRRGEVVVWDVRPREEYDAGHVSGARSVPLDQVRAELDRLPEDVEVVAYCRGPYCVLAVEAVRRLRAHGIAARQLEGGFPEWELEDRPIAQRSSA